MSLGTGYEYLLRSVARGDVETQHATPLTRYYAESGTPPGRFLGAGLAGLGDGVGVTEGTVAGEEDLFRLLGLMQDPLTRRQLGATPMTWRRAPQGESVPRPVAGFDLTFSVPKSVSALWAIADPAIQAVIYRAHQDAIQVALAWAEENVLFSRSGRGGVVQEPIRGVVAVGFDHWDSRAGDPHLHTHLVIANRAPCARDRVWRALDGRTLFRYVVAVSELHEGVLQDLLTERLGLAWEERIRRHSAVPRHEIAGVPDALISEFSRRSAQIEDTKNELTATFAAAHGRQPSRVEILRLRQHATLATRPAKQHHTLSDQTDQWRARARPIVGTETEQWARGLRDRAKLPALHEHSVDAGMLREIALLALHTVATRRATFGHANVLAEVHRQLHGARFATPTDRLHVADRTTVIALDQAVRLTPDSARRRGAELYTSREILHAETRLLDAARDARGPGLPPAVTEHVLAGARDATRLSGEQAAAVHAITGSGRVLDLLVGPAGTGKTTTITALRRVWEHGHGPGSVIGLAPSAAAAQVLGEELGITTDNTAKWLVEQPRNTERHDRIAALDALIRDTTSNAATAHARRLYRELDAVRDEHDRWQIRSGQLVIIDEASLAGTLALDQIVHQARCCGAKVLLVGDWAQLGAIEAGGAFAMLTTDRGDVPELREVHRFTHHWEADASTRLRVGDPSVIAAYAAYDRIRSGDAAHMADAVFQAWRDDTARGLNSVMIAADRDTVATLNRRAQADRVSAGEVGELRVEIADGHAGIGDRIVTRHNDRTLRTPGGWVKNGDAWTLTATSPDGSIRARRDSDRAEVRLPANYVRAQVELSYATTAHRVQGRTLDTAHALITTANTRETLYVAATRGRQSNTLYVDTTNGWQDDTQHGPTAETPATVLLEQVLGRTGADTSAHAARHYELARAQALEAEHAAVLFAHPPFVSGPWTPLPDIESRQIQTAL